MRNKINSFKRTHQILLGSLLGDMHLRKECKNPNIQESHSIKQKDYLEWKYKNLSNFFDLKLYSFNNPICKIKGKIYNRKPEFRLRSKVSEKLNFYYNLFYKNNTKRITLSILNQLDTLSLAVWYCDDGYYDLENHIAELHTEGFSIQENKIFKKWFKQKWNIDVNFKKGSSKKKFLLRFSVKESDKFLKLIKKHILKMPPTIRYKLGHLWKGNTESLNKAKLNKLKRNKIYNSKKKVKIKRAQKAKQFYHKNREKILKEKAQYRKTKEYKDYINEYYQRPNVKQRQRECQKEYRKKPKYKKKFIFYQREYRKRSEVKEKIKEYNKKAREKRREGLKLRH